MSDKKAQINFMGDPHFALDNAVFNDTVMEKIRNRKLNLSAIKVFMYLSRNRDINSGKLHGKDSKHPIKIKRIADYWNISIRSVRYAIQELTAAGLYVPPNRNSVDTVEGHLLPKRRDV